MENCSAEIISGAAACSLGDLQDWGGHLSCHRSPQFWSNQAKLGVFDKIFLKSLKIRIILLSLLAWCAVSTSYTAVVTWNDLHRQQSSKDLYPNQSHRPPTLWETVIWHMTYWLNDILTCWHVALKKSFVLSNMYVRRGHNRAVSKMTDWQTIHQTQCLLLLNLSLTRLFMSWYKIWQIIRLSCDLPCTETSLATKFSLRRHNRQQSRFIIPEWRAASTPQTSKGSRRFPQIAPQNSFYRPAIVLWPALVWGCNSKLNNEPSLLGWWLEII